MSTKDEIEDYLESKKLKNITLPDNSNDIDQGSNSSNQKIGQKNLAAADKEKLAWYDYIRERDKKMQYGDKQAIAEYVQEAAEIRQRLEEQKYQSRLDWELLQDEKKRLAKEAKITQQDRDKEAQDIQRLERKKSKEIANLQDYFNSSNEFWEEYQNNGHSAEESPAGALITQADNGTWCCDIHRYEKVLESPNNDWELFASSFTIEPVENHFRKDPKPHLEALIEIINEKYSKLIEARKEKTLEDKDVAFNKEVRQIESIKTRADGDMRVTKLTKGQKARLREAEEAQAEENRRIYSGLY